jgi:hypothetical protein
MKTLIHTPEIKYASLKGTHLKGWLIHQISNGLNHMSRTFWVSPRALVPLVVNLGENKLAHQRDVNSGADLPLQAVARKVLILRFIMILGNIQKSRNTNKRVASPCHTNQSSGLSRKCFGSILIIE